MTDRRLLGAVALSALLAAGCSVRIPEPEPAAAEPAGRKGPRERVIRHHVLPSIPAPTPLSGTCRFLRAEGTRVVDEDGREVRLRGCNIGGWLLLEPWIAGLDGQEGVGSEKDVWDVLGARFGGTTKQELIKAYRDNFFGEEDVRRIASLGLNCIRVPVWWRAVSDINYGGNIEYLDRCIRWCAANGVYAIIDLQGAPGGQAVESSNVGEPSNADLWRDPANRTRTIEWWMWIATRYRDEPAVAAYDLLNEGFSVPKYDQLVDLYDVLYREIRKIDPRHLIVMEDVWGFNRLPRAEDMGWSNVLYSFHFYVQSPDEAFAAAPNVLPRYNRTALHLGVPIYVGEFNSILAERGGAGTFLRYRELWDYYRWAWTFWTYNKIEGNRGVNWGLWGYSDDPPIPDLNRDSADTIRQCFEQFSTRYSEPSLAIQQALTAPVRWVPDDQLPLPSPDSRPLTLRDAFVLPAEKGSLCLEWGYSIPNAGYWSAGDTMAWRFTIETGGVFEAGLRMAAAAPTNTVRVWIDGVHAADARAPGTRGWRRYRDRPIGRFRLDAGTHTMQVGQGDTNSSFINLQYAWLRPSTAPLPPAETQIRLGPVNAGEPRRKSPIRVEWLNDPPNFAQWANREEMPWVVTLGRAARFAIRASYATDNAETTFKVLVDGKQVAEKTLASTGGWQTYKTEDIGPVILTPGRHEIRAAWYGPDNKDVGNLREVMFDRIVQAAAPAAASAQSSRNSTGPAPGSR